MSPRASPVVGGGVGCALGGGVGAAGVGDGAVLPAHRHSALLHSPPTLHGHQLWPFRAQGAHWSSVMAWPREFGVTATQAAQPPQRSSNGTGAVVAGVGAGVVGTGVGAGVGAGVGGTGVGAGVGAGVVGTGVGAEVGAGVVGAGVGAEVGAEVGAGVVGAGVGAGVGVGVG